LTFPHYFIAGTAPGSEFGPRVEAQHPCGVMMHSHAKYWPVGPGGIDPEGRVWLYCRDSSLPWEQKFCWVRLGESVAGDHVVKP